MWSTKVFLILGCLLHNHSVFSLWMCTQDADCSSTVGAFCDAGDCVCPTGQQLVLGGSACRDSAPYYTSSCFDDHQCSNLVTNFECRRTGESQEGNCLCQSGFHYFHGRCWRSVDHGGSCNRDEECMGILQDPYSLVCEAGTCGCAEGYYERQRGECRKIGYGVGDGCVLDEDCQFADGICDESIFRCTNSISDESLPYIVRSNVTNVTTRSLTRQHGNICDSVNACTSPFVCSTFGICVCPNGYYASSDATSCLAHLSSPATEEQCVGFLAEVIDGVCSCPPNIYYDENMIDCVKATLRFTDSCISDQMCHTFGAAVRCSEPQLPWGFRNCECIPEFSVMDVARSMCRLFVGIGENCQVKSDCLAGAMEIDCIADSEGQGICTCPEGYVAVDGLCLTSGLQLGDSCQASEECTEAEHSVCYAGLCSCDEGYQELDGFCAPTIGGTCLLDSDCTIENTVCVADDEEVSSTCQCGDRFVEYNDLCWPALPSIAAECNVTAQCSALMGPASNCVDNTCECEELHHLRDGSCWPRIGLFGSCSRTSECFLNEDSERVVCRNSLCQCSFEFPYSEQEHTCSSSASTAVGSIFTIMLALYYVML